MSFGSKNEQQGNCIFCRGPLNGSREHIIPASLNGRITSRKLICSDCNNFFGRKIDPVIKEVLNPLLLAFGFENASTIHFEDGQKQKWRLNKDLSFVPLKPIVEIHEGEKEKLLTIQGTEEQIKSIVEKTNKKLAPRNIRVTPKDIPQYFSPYAEQFRFPLSINTDDLRLHSFFAKIALEFAGHFGVEYIYIEQLCIKVRNMEANPVKFCNFYNEIRDFDGARLTHLLVVRNEGPILYVYIELFNIVCALVVLSRTYSGKKIKEFYHQDALTGERIIGTIKFKKNILQMLSDSSKNDNFERLINLSSDRLKEKKLLDTLKIGVQKVMDV